MEDLLLWARDVLRIPKIKISRRRLADYVKKNCTEVRAARVARLYFLVRPIRSLLLPSSFPKLPLN